MTATHYDLWLTAGNRVYKAVPYEVIADWLQQGRVLPTDRLREAGKGDWQTIDKVPTLAVYLPRAPAIDVADDRASALEPVELGIAVRHRKADEDDDVDMIPLIDISLVLLIFFMMTSSVAIGGASVAVPETKYATLTSDRGMLWVGVDRQPETGEPIYSLADGVESPTDEDSRLSLSELVQKVKVRLGRREGGTIVRVAAHRRLTFEQVKAVTAELTKLKPLGIVEIKAEVNEVQTDGKGRTP